MPEEADILVIGAGIAGASVAAELAGDARVIVLEQESQPGYHATGRSAAYFEPSYGNAVVRGLTQLSEPFFRQPPAQFSEVALLRPRDCLVVADQAQLPKLRAELAENPALEWLDPAAAMHAMPLFRADYLAGALRDVRGGDLDVDAILQGYLRRFRHRGGQLVTSAGVSALQWAGGAWQVEAGGVTYRVPVIVNAAGAWVDDVATLAGVGALGVQPLRRTALLLDVPAGYESSEWPMVGDVDEQFYFKPDAGQLLVSPADETPSPPCDAQPEELDVAVAVDRFEHVTGIQVRRVNHRWAGLRSFAPDRTFIAGFDPRAQGFFWLAGQGGYGVQSAPAMANLACALLTGSSPPASFAGVMQYRDAVAPQRLIT